MKHILKECKKNGRIWVDKELPSYEASDGDIVEIHTIDGSTIHKVLITGKCKDCSQRGLGDGISNGCFSVIGIYICPVGDTDLVFKDLDNIMESL